MGKIPAVVVRTVLEAVKETTGAQYIHILKKAGLDRFLLILPPNDFSPAAGSEEISHLYQAVFIMGGEARTRLFMRSYGRILAAKVMMLPMVQKLVAEAAVIEPDQRPAWFVRRAAEVNSQVWTQQIVSEDDTAWYWTSQPCLLCAGISGAAAPLCASPETLYSALAAQIIGVRLRVVEVECHATGDPYCKYAFYKPNPDANPQSA